MENPLQQSRLKKNRVVFGHLMDDGRCLAAGTGYFSNKEATFQETLGFQPPFWAHRTTQSKTHQQSAAGTNPPTVGLDAKQVTATAADITPGHSFV